MCTLAENKEEGLFHGAEGAAKALAAERGRTLASLWEELGYSTAQDSVDICSRLWYFMTHEAK